MKIAGFPVIPTGNEELYRRSRSNSRSGGRRRGGRSRSGGRSRT